MNVKFWNKLVTEKGKTEYIKSDKEIPFKHNLQKDHILHYIYKLQRGSKGRLCLQSFLPVNITSCSKPFY